MTEWTSRWEQHPVADELPDSEIRARALSIAVQLVGDKQLALPRVIEIATRFEKYMREGGR